MHRTNMRFFLAAGLISLAMLLPMACAKVAPVAEYKKYENDGDVPRISIEDAKKEYDAGTAIIVDSRPETAYKPDHIAKSLNIPLGSTDDKFAALPKDKKIIVYCS